MLNLIFIEIFVVNKKYIRWGIYYKVWNYNIVVGDVLYRVL